MSLAVDVVATGSPTRRLYRRAEGRVFGGVAAGLCEHLGLDTRRQRRLVRLGFVVLSFASGLGVVLYGAFWIIVPSEGSPAIVARRPLWQQYVIGAVAALAAAGLVFTTIPRHGYFVPIVLGGLGAALVWRQSSEYQRQRWTHLSAESLRSTATNRAGVIRLCAGVAMVVLGGVLVLFRGTSFDQILTTVFVAVIVLVGFALITGPIWLGLAGNLTAERRALIRAQERAELAARVHDSVLQTLALIQRNAASPREVNRLARGQERELRDLLYGTQPVSGSFATALREAVAQVEDDYVVSVDAVIVGDARITPALEAVAQASREALVNAGKHAGVDTVSLYAEIESGLAAVYVRDRGAGFEPADVPADRQGLRSSIAARVERHGGAVSVRSAPGQGTEIEIRMELS